MPTTDTTAPLLVLDMSNLAHRAYYTLGAPEQPDAHRSNRVVHGVLRDVVQLQQRFRTPRLAFCFDQGRSQRYALFPDYKRSRQQRRANDPYLAATHAEVEQQTERLRTQILPSLGFRNLFSHDGYEADDLLASLCLDEGRQDEETILITSDRDLYQVLDGRTNMFSPKHGKTHTPQTFHAEWKLSPRQWIDLKCLAGDEGDDIPGAAWVGEKTAATHLRGQPVRVRRARESIAEFIGSPQHVLNRKLVRLPFAGTPHLRLQDDQVTKASWRQGIEDAGLVKLLDLLPLCAR